MATILIADDEQSIRKIIGKYGGREGHEVLEAEDGLEAVQICKDHDVDLVIMDVMMPEMDGFSACKEIRRLRSDMPLIILSARGEEYDRIYGFELGVDDYVVKPFSPKELMMRVNAVLKRSSGEMDRDVVEFGGLKVDMTARKVTIDDQEVAMTPKEYELFFFMVKNRGEALTRERLLNSVWGYEFFGDDRTLDTHIKLLRKGLGEYGKCIVTLRGVGYRFEA